MTTKLQPIRKTASNGAGRAMNLTGLQVQMIEEALEDVGEFGEVRLVVEKGRLRFVVTQKSVDALKWRPSERAVELQEG